jgi:hypothetical protein
MKPAICKKHGAQRFTLTSPLLAKAVSGCQLGDVLLKKMRIYSNERWNEYWVDDEFLAHFLPQHSGDTIVLFDRDVAQNKMNDRLLIVKVTSNMEYICPVCLSEISGAV